MGSVSTYERDGRYSSMQGTVGWNRRRCLYERFQALRQELDEMGMFAEYKQPIPDLSQGRGSDGRG